MFIAELIHVVVGGTILCFGISGNVVVILYFGVIRRCKKNYDLLIFILGITDFLSCVTNFLYRWPMFHPVIRKKVTSEVFCYSSFIRPLTNKSSCYVLALVFYVRYRTLSRPLTNQITKGKILIAIVMLIMLALAACVPFVLTRKYNGYDCYQDMALFGPIKNFTILKILICTIGRFLIPLFIMIYCVYHSRQHLQKSNFTWKNNVVITKRNDRALRTLVWLIIIFIVSVGSYECVFLYFVPDLIQDRPFSRNEKFVRVVLDVLFYLNSSINVIIYAGYGAKFRAFCYRLFQCFLKVT